MTYNIALFRMQ